MEKEKLITRIKKADSPKEALCELERFEQQTTKNAFNFLFTLTKKRKSIKATRINKEWLGSKEHQGVFQELLSKHLRQYV